MSYRNQTYLFSLIALLLWVFIICKAVLVPPTQDEVTSFFDYIIGPWSRVFITNSTNNHFLNSFLGKVSCSLFGYNMFVFRLGNVMSFPLLAFFTWRLASALPVLSRWSLALGICCCYPIVEYFGLARGYGLSYALMLGSIYYLFMFSKKQSIKHAALSSICLVLAISANIALINFGISVLGIMILQCAVKPRLVKQLIWPALLIATAIVFYAFIGFKHTDIIQEHFKNQDGFYKNTVGTLLNMLTFSIDHWYTPIILAAPIVIGSSAFAFSRPSLKTMVYDPFFVVSMLFWLTVLGSVLLSAFFDIHYPTERVGLYFIPLYLILICQSAIHIPRVSLYVRTALLTPIAIPSSLIILAFASNLQLNKSDVEPYAHLPESIYTDILRMHENSGRLHPPIVQADERLSHAWRYYNFKHGGCLNPSIEPSERGLFNYEIANSTSGQKTAVSADHAILETRVPVKIWDSTTKDFIGLYRNPYSDNKPHVLAVNCFVEQDEFAPSNTYLSLKNKQGNETYYKGFPNDQLLISNNARLSYSWILPPCDSCIVSIYIHNIDAASISLE